MPPGDKKKKITNQQASSEISRRLSNIGTTFTKSDTKKYPYLGSQFQFDAKIFNPMKNQEPTQRRYRYSISDNTGNSRVSEDTHYAEAKYKQDKSLKGYFGGNKAQRESAEKGAKRAASISSNLQKSIYQSSKLLEQEKESEADSLAYEARQTAFNEQKRGGFGATEVSRRQYRNIQEISDAYFNPRIQQQAKNMIKEVQMSNTKITAPDAKEINASLRSLISRKKN